MLISDQKNFIFIHIYKTGGSSLTRLLCPFVDEKYRMTKTRLQGDGWQGTWHYAGRQHQRLATLRDDPIWRGRDLSRYRVCTVVRNPYSWALSVWNDFYRRIEDAPAWFNDLYPERSFRDFCRMINAARLEINPDVWGSYTQQSFVADREIRPAFIARFERIEEDTMKLLAMLDVPFAGMPHEIFNNPDERSDPTRFYDAESLAIVNSIYETDFLAYGYPMISL
jgi:hypothetical protein